MKILWKIISKALPTVTVYNIHCCPLIPRSGSQVVQSRFGTPILDVPNISLALHVLGDSFQEDLLCKSPRDWAVSKQLVVSQIFLLALLQGGRDVCLFFSVIQPPWLTRPFGSDSRLPVLSASYHSTTGGVSAGLTDCACADGLSALPTGGNAVLLQAFLAGSCNWEAWVQILLVKSKAKK